MFRELDPTKLKGTVITVPVVEMTGFQKGMDISPIDGLNPNGYYFVQGPLFPGNPDGTISNRIARTIFNEVIKKSDYHLDLRGGDLWETLHTFSISNETGNKDFDTETEVLAKGLGTKYYITAPYSKGSLISEACKAGIRSVILAASKGLANCDEEDVQSCLEGIHRLLGRLNMGEEKPDIYPEPKRLEYKMHFILAKHGGLLYLHCKQGEAVSENQKLGEIRNLKGEILQELFAPIDGIIHCTFPKHIKSPGELILGVRRILG